MPSLCFTIPYSSSLSTNRIWRRRRSGGVHLNSEARAIKEDIVLMVRSHMNALGLIAPGPDERVFVFLDASFPKRRGRKPDATNFLKLPIDAIAKAFGIDDKCFVGMPRRVGHNADESEAHLCYTVEWGESSIFARILAALEMYRADKHFPLLYNEVKALAGEQYVGKQ